MWRELVAQAAVGGDGVTGFDFGAKAVDELVKGVVGDAGAVFDIGVDHRADLVFGDNLVLVFPQQFQQPGFGGGKG